MWMVSVSTMAPLHVPSARTFLSTISVAPTFSSIWGHIFYTTTDFITGRVLAGFVSILIVRFTSASMDNSPQLICKNLVVQTSEKFASRLPNHLRSVSRVQTTLSNARFAHSLFGSTTSEITSRSPIPMPTQLSTNLCTNSTHPNPH